MINLKDSLTIGLSSAALIISGASAYYNVLRVTDDVRVIIWDAPVLMPDFRAQQFAIYPQKSSFIFINSGTRSVAISRVSLRIGQPTDSRAVSANGCNNLDVLYYDLEPFIVKAGDINSKNTEIVGVPYGMPERYFYTIKDGDIFVAASQANKSRDKYKYKVCLEVAFITPDTEYDSKTIYEFEDEIGPDVIGYGFSSSSNERPPIVLIRKTRWKFFSD